MALRIVVFILVFGLSDRYQGLSAEDEVWEQDLSMDMKIGLSTTGYRSVDLKCGPEAFLVNVSLNTDFEGVIYTRGDFQLKNKPCFLLSKDGKHKADSILFSLTIPFEKCHTVEDASDQQFINTLVVQHDEDLIMPGDAAFRLSCAFNPEQKLGSTLLAEHKSSIILVDADPASKKTSDFHRVFSESDSVSFPKEPTPAPKEEL